MTIPLDLDSDENAKVLVCNNEAIPSYENKTLTIKNISEETSCKTYSSLLEVSIQMDDTYNNIVLIKDENYLNEQITFIDKMGTIDLNGHVITFSRTENYNPSVIFEGENVFLFKTSKASGGIVLNIVPASGITHESYVLSVRNNSKLTILNGYYGSNTNNDVVGTIQVGKNTEEERPILNIDGEEADNCTSNIEDYHTGLCIYNNRSACLKNNGSNENGIINIYGGSLVSNKYAYMTDAKGGELNIYGGTLNAASYSIYTKTNDKNIVLNICGGEFLSPVDIYAMSDTIPIYYRNGINWKNGSTPTISGTYQNNVQLKPDLNCKY